MEILIFHTHLKKKKEFLPATASFLTPTFPTPMHALGDFLLPLSETKKSLAWTRGPHTLLKTQAKLDQEAEGHYVLV